MRNTELLTEAEKTVLDAMIKDWLWQNEKIICVGHSQTDWADKLVIKYSNLRSAFKTIMGREAE